jgi:hypothetical protein
VLARPYGHEGDTAILTRLVRPRAHSDVFPVPAGDEIIVTRFWAARFKMAISSSRWIGPGSALPGARPEPAAGMSVIAPSPHIQAG